MPVAQDGPAGLTVARLATTSDYCSDGCQSQCGGGGSTPSPSVTSSLFDQMLKHRNNAACPANGFYTYDAFIAAANAFSGFGTSGDVITQKRGFGTTGDVITQKREIAAFLAQTSHETTGGWASAPDGPYAWRWGYCYKQEQGNPRDYNVQSTQWPCAVGKKYYGRGTIQISYNYNYGPTRHAINSDLLNNPDLVATDPTISFKTVLWFWMTTQSPKPSCHSVANGGWPPRCHHQRKRRVRAQIRRQGGGHDQFLQEVLPYSGSQLWSDGDQVSGSDLSKSLVLHWPCVA